MTGDPYGKDVFKYGTEDYAARRELDAKRAEKLAPTPSPPPLFPSTPDSRDYPSQLSSSGTSSASGGGGVLFGLIKLAGIGLIGLAVIGYFQSESDHAPRPAEPVTPEQTGAVSSPAPAPALPVQAGQPKPFEPGTLNASLLGETIVRRVRGNTTWYFKDGRKVDPVYGLEGQTKSYLLDPPKQRPTTDAEVVSAHQVLQHALESYWGTRKSALFSDGRLLYRRLIDEQNQVHSEFFTLATLDFTRAHRRNQDDGLSEFAIPCKEDAPCVIGIDRDGAEKVLNYQIYHTVDIYFIGDENGQAVWDALWKLRTFYPAEPSVEEVR